MEKIEGSFSRGETLRGGNVKFTNSRLGFSLFYFSLLFSFCFIFLFSIFRTNRVRVGSQDIENKEGQSRTNDVTQHGLYMVV